MIRSPGNLTGRPFEILHGDGGAGLSGDAGLGFLQQGDEGGTAGLALREFDGGLDLGQHGAGGELALRGILLGLRGRQMVQPFLVGLAVVDGDLFHGGEDDERVGVQLLSQQLGGKVLVDDGTGALEVVAFGG